MDAAKKAELLSELKNDFDDYIDYYDLMSCIPDLEEARVESLKRNRNTNGLSEFSFYTHCNRGVFMASASKFRVWAKNNFKKVTGK